MHHLVWLASAATQSFMASSASGSSTDNTFRVAIVTTIGVVLAAAITALATTFSRDRGAAPTVAATTKDFLNELQRRAEAAERREQILQRKTELLSRRVDELEGYCWRHLVDPNTGLAITSNEQAGQ